MLLSVIKEEFLFNCQCRKLSDATIRNYSNQIGYLLNYLKAEKDVEEIEEAEPSHIKQFLLQMKRNGRSVNYFNDLLKAFKVFFRYAYEEGYAETLLTAKIKNAKGDKTIIRTFSEQETKRIINHYHGHKYLDIRNKVMLMLLVDTGIRIGELIRLTEEQIKHDYIIIKGKGGKERVVPKSPLLSKWIIKYLAVRKAYFQYRATDNNIFLSKNGKILGDAIIDRIIKDAGRACDISRDVRVSAHTFRHTYAQYQLKSGLDIYTLSRLLGHENISITQTYLNGLRDEEVLEQAQKTSPLMNL
ncbi:MAG: tyrosine-type recombinase/integrase [Defluviitaleaceae bacterium]|nr:tyrosine-type recombinase/integrase [Defluviitaleaceae bacterium]